MADEATVSSPPAGRLTFLAMALAGKRGVRLGSSSVVVSAGCGALRVTLQHWRGGGAL